MANQEEPNRFRFLMSDNGFSSWASSGEGSTGHRRRAAEDDITDRSVRRRISDNDAEIDQPEKIDEHTYDDRLLTPPMLVYDDTQEYFMPPPSPLHVYDDDAYMSPPLPSPQSTDSYATDFRNAINVDINYSETENDMTVDLLSSFNVNNTNYSELLQVHTLQYLMPPSPLQVYDDDIYISPPSLSLSLPQPLEESSIRMDMNNLSYELEGPSDDMRPDIDNLSYEDEDLFDDMRMDIDNLPYEEMLELEDGIGRVRKGLSERSALIHIKKVTFMPNEEETHCTICQEECKENDQLGYLTCGHYFHHDELMKWLQIRSECPLCRQVPKIFYVKTDPPCLFFANL